MADELSQLNFAQDLAEALQVEDAQRWKVEKVGALEIYAEISSVKAPDEKFQARLLWVVYPDEPPSIKFRDPQSGRLDMATAWPIVRGFRPANLDTCVNYSSEGFVTHPEWKKDLNLKWNSNGNAVLRILRTLQSEVDEHFSGRFKQ
jgi:hypothetical protein